MIMKFPEGNITINNKKRLKNLRFNIADDGSHRILIKCSVLDELNEIPVDLYVSEFSSPKISGIGVELELSGLERNFNTKFTCKAKLNILHHKWKVKIKYGSIHINRSINNLMELFEILINIIGGTENE